MVALVQIRKCEKRSQQHNLQPLPIRNVKPSGLTERRESRAVGGVGRTCSGYNPKFVPSHSECEMEVPMSRPQVQADRAFVS